MGQTAQAGNGEVGAQARVWRRAIPLGEPEAIRGLGGTVAPVLVGFSLATIALLTTSTTVPPLADWSVGAFSIAVALLLIAMQLAFMSLRYSPPMSERALVNPRAQLFRGSFEAERKVQFADAAAAHYYKVRTYYFYDRGLIAFLVGLSLLMWPHSWSVPAVIAFTGAAVGTLVELIWIASPAGGPAEVRGVPLARRLTRRLANAKSPFQRWRARMLPTRKTIIERPDMSEYGTPGQLDEQTVAALVAERRQEVPSGAG